MRVAARALRDAGRAPGALAALGMIKREVPQRSPATGYLVMSRVEAAGASIRHAGRHYPRRGTAYVRSSAGGASGLMVSTSALLTARLPATTLPLAGRPSRPAKSL